MGRAEFHIGRDNGGNGDNGGNDILHKDICQLAAAPRTVLLIKSR